MFNVSQEHTHAPDSRPADFHRVSVLVAVVSNRRDQSALIAGVCLVGAIAIVAVRVLWVAIEGWLS